MIGSANVLSFADFRSFSSFSTALCLTGLAFSSLATAISSVVGAGNPVTISFKDAFPIGITSSSAPLSVMSSSSVSARSVGGASPASGFSSVCSTTESPFPSSPFSSPVSIPSAASTAPLFISHSYSFFSLSFVTSKIVSPAAS